MQTFLHKTVDPLFDVDFDIPKAKPGPKKKAQCSKGHALSGENLKIKKKKSGRIIRQCAICEKASWQRHNAKRSKKNKSG